MADKDQQLSEKESLALIASMINKARDIYHDTGISGIMWGSVIAICCLVKLSEIHFEYRLPFDIYLLTFVAVIPQIIISIREKRSKKVRQYEDRFFDYLWISFGISIFLLILAINAIFSSWGPVATEYRLLTGQPSPFRLNEYIQSLFLILYGFPTFITGAVCKFRPMLWGGILCWALAIVALFTTLKIDLLLTAVAAIMAWLIPGIIAEREYRKAKRQELLNV